MLTVREAAVRAGVSDSLIYAWVTEGTLPCLRLGRKGKRGTIRIAPEDLDVALATFRVVPSMPSASSDRPCSPFSELNSKRLAQAWTKR